MEENILFKLIPADVLLKAIANISDTRDILAPYLQSLTNEERKKIYKVADGTEAFVEKGISYTKQFPQFAPKQMDVAGMNNDYEMMTSLLPLLQVTVGLASLMSDTKMLAANTMKQLLKYYNSVKQASKENVADAKDVYADMSKRYKKRKRKTAAPAKGAEEAKDVHIA